MTSPWPKCGTRGRCSSFPSEHTLITLWLHFEQASKYYNLSVSYEICSCFCEEIKQGQRLWSATLSVKYASCCSVFVLCVCAARDRERRRRRWDTNHKNYTSVPRGDNSLLGRILFEIWWLACWGKTSPLTSEGEPKQDKWQPGFVLLSKEYFFLLRCCCVLTGGDTSCVFHAVGKSTREKKKKRYLGVIFYSCLFNNRSSFLSLFLCDSEPIITTAPPSRCWIEILNADMSFHRNGI